MKLCNNLAPRPCTFGKSLTNKVLLLGVFDEVKFVGLIVTSRTVILGCFVKVMSLVKKVSKVTPSQLFSTLGAFGLNSTPQWYVYPSFGLARVRLVHILSIRMFVSFAQL